jgi:hypothetical protein
MKRLVPLFFVLIILIPVGYALGFRFHPEALLKRLSPQQNTRFKKILLNSGRTLIGEVVRETPESVKVAFVGGSLMLSKKDIASMEPADPQSGEYDEFADEIVMVNQKPIITYRPEDSLLYKPTEQRGAWLKGLTKTDSESKGEAAEKKASESPNWMDSENVDKIMKLAENSQALAEQKLKQQEDMMKQMEEGG